MIRFMICLTLVLGLSFTRAAVAESSGSGGGGGSGGSEISGRIQSVTSTTFSVGTHVGRRHRKLKPVVVHYNPETVSLTVDGVAVHSLDVAATDKYVSVVGSMKNNVLEATSIAVTTEAPTHPKPIKSKNPT